MRTYVYLLSLLLAGLSIRCTPDHSQQVTEEVTQESDLPAPTFVKPTFVIPDAFAIQLDTLLSKYMTLKDGFVKTDTISVDQYTEAMVAHVEKIDSVNLPTDAQSKWREYKKMLIRSAQTLKASSKMEEKRISFENISQEMYAIINDFGAKTTLYKQYCPMAHHSKGGYWLSLQQEIRNPYFGDQMLECGEVQQILTFDE